MRLIDGDMLEARITKAYTMNGLTEEEYCQIIGFVEDAVAVGVCCENCRKGIVKDGKVLCTNGVVAQTREMDDYCSRGVKR